jgi:hypothetical protein
LKGFFKKTSVHLWTPMSASTQPKQSAPHSTTTTTTLTWEVIEKYKSTCFSFLFFSIFMFLAIVSTLDACYGSVEDKSAPLPQEVDERAPATPSSVSKSNSMGCFVEKRYCCVN